MSLLYNFGILGSPNYSIKSFLNDKIVSSIVSSNTVYLYSVDSKIKTLLSYYLPSSKVINSFEESNNYKYIITSENYLLDNLYVKDSFKTIKIFDNHLLFENIYK